MAQKKVWRDPTLTVLTEAEALARRDAMLAARAEAPERAPAGRPDRGEDVASDAGSAASAQP
jgi:hypothetical protein